MAQLRRFYIYVIFDLNGVPRYVGKGSGNRWNNHFDSTCQNPHLRNIIKQANRLGKQLPRFKLRHNMTLDEAVEFEIALISLIGREVDGGTLVNFTLGGDGLVNPSPKTRDKMRRKRIEYMKDPEHRANLAKFRIGIPLKTETREILKRAHIGTMHTKQRRKNQSTALKGRAFSEDHKKALSQASKGRPKTLSIIVDGAAMSLAKFCRLNELNYSTIRARIRYHGMSFEEAIKLPCGKPNPNRI